MWLSGVDVNGLDGMRRIGGVVIRSTAVGWRRYLVACLDDDAISVLWEMLALVAKDSMPMVSRHVAGLEGAK